MQTSYISTAALRNAPRAEIVRLQAELTDRTTEVSTGRKADVGLALGNSTGLAISSRNELNLLETLIQSNGSATARLSQTQTALDDLRKVGSDMLGSLSALPTGSYGASAINIQARTFLDQMTDRLNGSDGGSYLFGGQNSTVEPLTRFADGPQAAIEAAFATEFGFPVGDPLAATITAAQMETFLATDFTALFDLPSWTSDWSVASSTNMMSRISSSERVETGTNANEASIRTLAKGLSMVAGLGFESLSQQARDVIASRARVVFGEAISTVVSLKSALGYAENAIERANQRMALASDLVETRVANLEGADPAEAKTRIDLITTQIEMSYAMTNQLSRLSILNYA